MEENIFILMADLSGYTALTETHGAVSAADLIDKYVDIVESCLVGDSKLQERTGDEVMVISTSPDFLLSTAANIIQSSSREDHFLQVHGGLHYGKVLKRKNSYFGSAINLTARITAKANPGTFWCSREFINELSTTSSFTLHSKGMQSFKNVQYEKEVAELVIEKRHPAFIDPVCKMMILDQTTATPHPEAPDLFFCSAGCLEVYTRSQSAVPAL